MTLYLHCYSTVLTLTLCSNSGKVLNFKIMNIGGSEFYISPRRKFPSAMSLLQAYRSAPIRSKKTGSAKIFLLHPIPVDPTMELCHKKTKEDKGQSRGQSTVKGSWCVVIGGSWCEGWGRVCDVLMTPCSCQEGFLPHKDSSGPPPIAMATAYA